MCCHQEKLSPSANQPDFFSTTPWVQATSYCNSTLFTSLLKSGSSSLWEENSGGPAVPPSPILCPTLLYPLIVSLPDCCQHLAIPDMEPFTSLNVFISLWSLYFRSGLSMFPAGQSCFIPILASHPHLAALVCWPWCYAQWPMLILIMCFISTGTRES